MKSFHRLCLVIYYMKLPDLLHIPRDRTAFHILHLIFFLNRIDLSMCNKSESQRILFMVLRTQKCCLTIKYFFFLQLQTGIFSLYCVKSSANVVHVPGFALKPSLTLTCLQRFRTNLDLYTFICCFWSPFPATDDAEYAL